MFYWNKNIYKKEIIKKQKNFVLIAIISVFVLINYFPTTNFVLMRKLKIATIPLKWELLHSCFGKIGKNVLVRNSKIILIIFLSEFLLLLSLLLLESVFDEVQDNVLKKNIFFSFKVAIIHVDN